MFCPACGQEAEELARFCCNCGRDFQLVNQNFYSPSRAVSLERFAGFWRRFAAYLIDHILVTIVAMVIGFIFGLIIGLLGGGKQSAQVAGFIIGITTSWLYWSIMESSIKQATLGKMALGIVVTDTNGKRISFGKATGRYFGKIISGLILGIGFMMAGWTQKKQALHDLMADTLVVKKQDF